MNINEYKIVDLFPYKIKDRSKFLFNNHPKDLHPESQKYKDYWKEQYKRCIEGHWVNDDGTWVYMMPKLYFYINVAIISDVKEDNKSARALISPRLRDNEWIIMTYTFCAQGFSGFEKDTEYTCHETIGRLEKGTEIDEVELKALPENTKKPDGTYKKFIPAWDYLTRHYLIDNPAKEPLGLPLYDNPIRNILIFTSRGLGKDNKWDTKVYKEDGQCIIDDIKVGDKIYGADGKLTTVIDRADYYNQMQYKVTFEDGRETYCGDGHLWEIYKVGGSGNQSYVLPLKEIRKNYLGYEGKVGDTKRVVGKRDSKYFVKMCEPVQYPEKDLLIDPYFLGLWLGDGFSKSPAICSEDVEIKDYAKKYFTDLGLNIRSVKKTPDTNPEFEHIFGVKRPPDHKNKLTELLRHYNLINNKHIPTDYLYASVEQRMELVRGLMDTDGYIDKYGQIEITQKNEQILDGLKLILASLGIKYHKSLKPITEWEGKKLEIPWIYHRLTINTDKEIFKLTRKKERLREPQSRATYRKRNFNAIRSIEPYKVEHSVCLGVDNATSLFLCDEYIVTHNSLIMFTGVFMHEFLTGGIKKWEQAKDIMKSPLLFFAGSSDERKMNKTLRMIKTFYDNMPGTYSSYNYKNEQVFKPSPFYRKLMGSWKLGESLIHSYKSGDGRDLGSKSMIEFNSIHSHDVATGDRYSMIFVEELGLLKISMQFHDSTKDTLVVNGVKVGMFIGLGTGGDVERVQESKIMFTQPDGYDVYPLANFWENPLNKIGLFIPIQYRDERYKDKQGNTLLEIAHKKEYEDLMKKKERGSSRSFKTHLMNNPFIPSQIFQTSKYSVFPSDAAINRLTEIETFDLWKKKATVGSLQYSEQARYGVKFVLDEENKLKPITKYLGFDIEKDDTEGALVIYEQPPDIIPTGLYKVVYDPVSKEGVGSSLNSVIVYKGLSIGDNQGMRNNIVAEWIGRLASLRETWERVYMLSRYYNCKIFPETNTPGFVDYIRRTKMQGQILQPSASYVEKELFKNYKHDQSKVGFDVRGNRGQMTFFLDNAINDWLMEDAETDPTTGNTIRRTIDTIYSTRLLEEIAYFDESNFDHISSLRGLMLWLANDRKQSTYKVETEVDTTPKKFESFFTIKKTKNKFLTY